LLVRELQKSAVIDDAIFSVLLGKFKENEAVPKKSGMKFGGWDEQIVADS
jgi:hypothetical protein